MGFVTIIPIYFSWHYGRAFSDLFRIWRNFLWFTYHFFSIGLLFRTLLSPWKRLNESKKKGFNPGDFFASLLVNTIMRIIGFVMRTIVIFFGLISLMIAFFAGIIAILLWIFLPAIVLVIFVSGFRLVF